MTIRNKAILILLISVMAFCGARSAFAQTYSGYLKLDDINGKGPDSLFVTITVPESFYNGNASAHSKYRSSRNSYKAYYATPWMAAVKTNILSDVVAIPAVGFEVKLVDNLSLDLGGWWSKWNIIYPNDQTKIYGASPELRWWFGKDMMRRGHFVGVHGMAAWYTLQWKEKGGTTVIYQNGLNDIMDTGSTSPSWSCGVTYGYSLPINRSGSLGFDFYVGLGYQSYQYKRIVISDNGSTSFTHHAHNKFGLTKIGTSLSYRFSLRRTKH